LVLNSPKEKVTLRYAITLPKVSWINIFEHLSYNF